MQGKKNLRNRTIEIAALLLFLILLTLEISGVAFGKDAQETALWKMIIPRLIGGTVFMLLAVRVGYRIFGCRERRCGVGLLLALPCLLVAVNNFPFIGVITSSITVERADLIPLFVLECFAIALYEEMAFRGFVFPYILERFHKGRAEMFLSIVLSGAVFSLVHLTNLFSGGSPGAVFLQIGYSFLIGSMCAVVLLRTANVWACVLIHTVYDFGGLFVPTVAGGRIWDGATVTITAVLGVLVAAWTVWLFFGTEESDAERLLSR